MNPKYRAAKRVPAPRLNLHHILPGYPAVRTFEERLSRFVYMHNKFLDAAWTEEWGRVTVPRYIWRVWERQGDTWWRRGER